MNTYTARILFWAPRVLCILFAIFISLFALDVFSEGYGMGETLLALLIHLVPTFLILISLIIAWRWERVGVILFIALALFLLVSSGAESWLISGPLFFVGVLFLISWMTQARLKTP